MAASDSKIIYLSIPHFLYAFQADEKADVVQGWTKFSDFQGTNCPANNASFSK